MAITISLLRGINIIGHNLIKMADLKALYESLRFREVRTYIQSGNVIFESDVSNPAKLEQQIEKAIKQKFGYHVSVWAKTPADFKKILTKNPFKKEDPKKLYFTFLSQNPPTARSNTKSRRM